jgi:serine protease AprX
MRRVTLFIIILLISVTFLHAQDEETISTGKYWVFFKDKGNKFQAELIRSLTGSDLGLPSRAMIRRAKVRRGSQLLDDSDLPVSMAYIRELRKLDLKPLTVSRWLNSVSIRIPENQIQTVLSMPFVSRIQPVARLSIPVPHHEIAEHPPAAVQDHDLDYGESYPQNSQIHIPEVHDLGINGRGVYIGMMDTGFDHEGREVFSRMTILDEYDFHADDGITANQEGDISSQHNHGTQTLSVIGGFDERHLIGPAYGSAYALAKTEWMPSETHVEEDDWVQGLQWLVDTVGVDIISCSLGYTTFDEGGSYTYSDLNGDVCVTTIAADAAASRGVVMVNSAGNERLDSWHYVVSPADGDSVIAAGAVTLSGNLASFSSAGPTYDGRIKPDVVALGVGVLAVNPSDSYTYAYVNGTSFSCPLIAGVCALVLQAHPELGPMDVREAIRQTADQADLPNNDYGWGLVNAYEAIFYHGVIFTNFFTVSIPVENQKIVEADIISKSDIDAQRVTFYYRGIDEDIFQEVAMDRKNGAESSRYAAVLPLQNQIEDVLFYIEAVDEDEITHIGPHGAPEVLYSFSDNLDNVVTLRKQMPQEFKMYPNFPNPFNTETTLQFDLIQKTHTEVSVYNIRGQHIVTLLNTVLESGRNRIRWNGMDKTHLAVPSGVYFCRIKTQNHREFCKMIMVQ